LPCTSESGYKSLKTHLLYVLFHLVKSFVMNMSCVSSLPWNRRYLWAYRMTESWVVMCIIILYNLLCFWQKFNPNNININIINIIICNMCCTWGLFFMTCRSEHFLFCLGVWSAALYYCPFHPIWDSFSCTFSKSSTITDCADHWNTDYSSFWVCCCVV